MRAKFAAIQFLQPYQLILTEQVGWEQCSVLRQEQGKVMEFDHLSTQNTKEVYHIGYIWNFVES